jgi:hypothetical protein
MTEKEFAELIKIASEDEEMMASAVDPADEEAVRSLAAALRKSRAIV